MDFITKNVLILMFLLLIFGLALFIFGLKQKAH